MSYVSQPINHPTPPWENTESRSVWKDDEQRSDKKGGTGLSYLALLWRNVLLC